MGCGHAPAWAMFAPELPMTIAIDSPIYFHDPECTVPPLFLWLW